MATLQLAAADNLTEDLIQYVVNGVPDEILDTIDIQRELASSEDLVSEPVTLLVTITLTPAIVNAIVKLIEKWLENHRELKSLEIVADGFSKSSEAGRSLSRLAQVQASTTVVSLVTANGAGENGQDKTL